MQPRERFLQEFQTALTAGAFVRCTFSKNVGAEDEDLQNVYIRPVELRDGRKLSVVSRYPRKDETRNISYKAALGEVTQWLECFEHAYLFTTTGDWQLRLQSHGREKLKASKPSFAATPTLEHDRPKRQALGETALPFLRALGVVQPDGQPRQSMAGKLRQIERYGEIIGHLLEGLSPQERPLRVLDAGAGKGYLTFAVAHLLRQRSIDAEVIGLELRQELVDLANGVATETGLASTLRFEAGAIDSSSAEAPLDVLIALHACDTATDDAIHLGIQRGAELIVTAPCCHRELRPQIVPPALLEGVLAHGILAERQAELLTDGIRALVLELHGYKAEVFEFISTEHTGRNVMITARKRTAPFDGALARAQLQSLLTGFGLRQQRLAHLLGEL